MKQDSLFRKLLFDRLFRAVFIYAIVSSVAVATMFFAVFAIHFPIIEEFLYDYMSACEASIIYDTLENIFSKMLRGIALFFLFSTSLAVFAAYRYVEKRA